MKLSIVVPAWNSAKRLPALLAQLAPLADELVVLVDSSSSDDSEAVARTFTDCVYQFKHDPFFVGFRSKMFERCTGDWILHIDDDETLSPAWTRDAISRLMENRRITQYYIPRRWLVDEGVRYLCNAPWYPDFAQRLFRNIPSIIEIPLAVHPQMRIAGEADYLTDLHIYHWNLLVYDRGVREQKLAAYVLAEPENPGGEFYLYEDFYHQAETFDDRPIVADRAPPAVLGTSEYCVNISIVRVPERFVAGVLYPIEIEMRNRSTRSLAPEIPYREPRNLSYSHHWFQMNAGSMNRYAYGTSRFALPTIVQPGEKHRALIDVRCPDAPGEYLLTFDLVEEFKAWFWEADPLGHRDVRNVTVEPMPGNA